MLEGKKIVMTFAFGQTKKIVDVSQVSALVDNINPHFKLDTSQSVLEHVVLIEYSFQL